MIQGNSFLPDDSNYRKTVSYQLVQGNSLLSDDTGKHFLPESTGKQFLMILSDGTQMIQGNSFLSDGTEKLTDDVNMTP